MSIQAVCFSATTSAFYLTLADGCNQTFIDGTRAGNISRFINHSCEPNLARVVLRYGRVAPSLCFFARRDIEANEELCYDYGAPIASTSASDVANLKQCFCNAPSCRRVLAASDYETLNNS